MAKKEETGAAPELGAEVLTGDTTQQEQEQGPTVGEGAEPSPAADIVRLTECDVLVKRDIACVIATTVYGHELPVLAAAHGPDHIEVTAQREIAVAGFNVVAEFDRLRRKYNDKNRDPLKEAMPLGLRSLEELTGVSASPHAQRVDALVKTRELPEVREAA